MQDSELKKINNWFCPSDSCLTERCSLFKVCGAHEMKVVGMTDTRATSHLKLVIHSLHTILYKVLTKIIASIY